MYIGITEDELNSSDKYIQHSVNMCGGIFMSIPPEMEVDEDDVFVLGNYRYVNDYIYRQLKKKNSSKKKVISQPKIEAKNNNSKSKTPTKKEVNEIIKMGERKGGAIKTLIDFLFGAKEEAPVKKKTKKAKKNGSSRPVKSSPKTSNKSKDEESLSELDEAERRWQ